MFPSLFHITVSRVVNKFIRSINLAACFFANFLSHWIFLTIYVVIYVFQKIYVVTLQQMAIETIAI